MRLSATHLVFIVQSVFILILFLIVLLRKKPEEFDYNRVKGDIESSLRVLEDEFKALSEENIILYNKIDSLKEKIPNNKKSLERINKEIQRLNETYTNFNYRDSTDQAIIRRLSRGFN